MLNAGGIQARSFYRRIGTLPIIPTQGKHWRQKKAVVL